MRKQSLRDKSKVITASEVDISSVKDIKKIINNTNSKIVLNLASPWLSTNVMQACLDADANYIDTSVCTDLFSKGQEVPSCYDPQWAFRDQFKDKGITGILGIGFDPGVVSCYVRHALKHYVDSIDSIDILDVNAGDHGKKWATNFDPECNLLEIQGDSFYYENNQWKRVPCHTREIEYTFPEVGRHKLYSMAHDEVKSLSKFVKAGRIEFWMAFSDNYLNYFNALKDIGLLSPSPVLISKDIAVSPLKVVKAVLPEPSSLAASYTGKTCIGSLIKGRKERESTEVFIYNTCSHAACYHEVESHAISYTAGVPPVAAAILVAQKVYDCKSLVNVEELDPTPVMNLLGSMGLVTKIEKKHPMDAAE